MPPSTITSGACENWPPDTPSLSNGASPDLQYLRQFSQSNIRATVRCCNMYGPMDQANSDRIHELCSLIAVEQDRQKFLGLVEELSRILSAQDNLPNNQPDGQKKD